MKKAGLVLEGGGMRGVYFAGVLDYLMEKGLYLPYVIGVSAGACQAVSYISRQKGRGKESTIGYIGDPRYLSLRNLIKERSLFGMKFLFEEIPNKLVPFDNETFNASEQEFTAVTTDCLSGDPVYFRKEDGEEISAVLQASCSLPFISKAVRIDDRILMDGGIADPIPIRKSIEDGNARNVVLLSRNRGYRKKPFKHGRLARWLYPNYPGLVKALERRHQSYNDSLQLIEKLEEEGSAFVIRPSQPITVDRLEKDPEKLLDLYRLGYEDCGRCYQELSRWL